MALLELKSGIWPQQLHGVTPFACLPVALEPWGPSQHNDLCGVFRASLLSEGEKGNTKGRADRAGMPSDVLQ